MAALIFIFDLVTYSRFVRNYSTHISDTRTYSTSYMFVLQNLCRNESSHSEKSVFFFKYLRQDLVRNKSYLLFSPYNLRLSSDAVTLPRSYC